MGAIVRLSQYYKVINAAGERFIGKAVTGNI